MNPRERVKTVTESARNSAKENHAGVGSLLVSELARALASQEIRITMLLEQIDFLERQGAIEPRIAENLRAIYSA